jgi:hypothetical protein
MEAGVSDHVWAIEEIVRLCWSTEPRKMENLAMSRRRIVLWVIAVLAICVVVLRPLACRQMRIDACLDAGGRWDYDAQRCDR